jgi:hypothetical protein
LGLKESFKLFWGQIAIAEDFREQAWPNDFSRMHGNDGDTTIWMQKKMMASLGSNNLESGIGEGPNDLFPSPPWQAAHDATLIV